MPLASGTRLAVYEIQAPIGAGGMGEVYRGTDTKLGRGVALKILPTAMAQDADRLARFHREARAVAALNHPGWYWFPLFFNAYRQHDYQGALDVVLKVNMPAFWRTHFALATAYAQLGERDAASNAVRELLTIRPDFRVVARDELRKWWDAELIQHLIDGLRKAGLEIAGDDGAPPARHAAT
jgi:serine/threonine protein kinase